MIQPNQWDDGLASLPPDDGLTIIFIVLCPADSLSFTCYSINYQFIALEHNSHSSPLRLHFVTQLHATKSKSSLVSKPRVCSTSPRTRSKSIRKLSQIQQESESNNSFQCHATATQRNFNQKANTQYSIANSLSKYNINGCIR